MKLLFITLMLSLSACASADYNHDDFGDENSPLTAQQYNDQQGRQALGRMMHGFGNNMQQNQTQTCTIWSASGNTYTQSCQ